MGSIRNWEFITGPTTPVQPAATTPVSSSDLTPKSYVDGTTVTFTIANNISSATDVTGVSFSSASYKAAFVKFFIHRQDAGQDVDSMGFLMFVYDAVGAAWRVTENSFHDEHGVTFSVTAGGQLQYVSTNFTGGSYASASTFRWTTIDLIGV